MAKHRTRSAVKHAPHSVHKSRPHAAKHGSNVIPLRSGDLADMGDGTVRSLYTWPMQTFELMMSPMMAWMDQMLDTQRKQLSHTNKE